MSEYSELLKDPRWQKRRLEVLSSDNFTCQRCGDTESTLHVHHFKYSGKPWEAESDALQTICEDCHWLEHKREHLTALEGRLVEIVMFQHMFEVGVFWSHDSAAFCKNHIKRVIALVRSYYG